MGAQETIIYRLVTRKPGYDAYFRMILIFQATFGGKMGVAITDAPVGIGLLYTTKTIDL